MHYVSEESIKVNSNYIFLITLEVGELLGAISISTLDTCSTQNGSSFHHRLCWHAARYDLRMNGARHRPNRLLARLLINTMLHVMACPALFFFLIRKTQNKGDIRVFGYLVTLPLEIA